MHINSLLSSTLCKSRFFWKKVSKENKPLRFTKDGKVISVDEDYFDSEIMKYLDPKKSNIDISVDALFDSEILKNSGFGTYFILHRVNILMEQVFKRHT